MAIQLNWDTFPGLGFDETRVYFDGGGLLCECPQSANPIGHLTTRYSVFRECPTGTRLLPSVLSNARMPAFSGCGATKPKWTGNLDRKDRQSLLLFPRSGCVEGRPNYRRVGTVMGGLSCRFVPVRGRGHPFLIIIFRPSFTQRCPRLSCFSSSSRLFPSLFPLHSTPSLHPHRLSMFSSQKFGLAKVAAKAFITPLVITRSYALTLLNWNANQVSILLHARSLATSRYVYVKRAKTTSDQTGQNTQHPLPEDGSWNTIQYGRTSISSQFFPLPLFPPWKVVSKLQTKRKHKGKRRGGKSGAQWISLTVLSR